MKGVIADCLSELVIRKKGKDKWEKILENAGLDKNTKFLATQDIDDAIVMKVVNTVCRELNKSFQNTATAFGIYWVKYYAPKMYRSYFGNAKTSEELLLKMNEIHNQVTKNIKNSSPPRFEYERPEDKILIMTYKSKRNLMDFFIGLVQGVGKYFNEELSVTKIGANKIKIIFP